jgi:hypothetical protein
MNKRVLIRALPILALIIVVILYLLFYGKETMSKEQFVDFYTDMILAQDSLGADINTTKLIRNNLYKKYNISEEIYIQTLNYYRDDPKKMEEFFNEVLIKLEKLKKKSEKI